MIKQLWPPIAEYIQDLLMKSIEPMIQGSLNGFKFVNIDMGDDVSFQPSSNPLFSFLNNSLYSL